MNALKTTVLSVLVSLSLVMSVARPASADPEQVIVAKRKPYIPEGGERRGRLHVNVDAGLRGGVGGQGMIGAMARGTAQLVAWNSKGATGTFDFGAMLSYDNEPTSFAPWLSGKDISGAGHRMQLTATVGHTFHLGQRRRFSLGTHVFGGYNHFTSSYRVRYPEVGVDAAEQVKFDRPLVGGEIRLGYRFSERVGWNLAMGAPFPTDSSYVLAVAYATTGLTVYIR